MNPHQKKKEKRNADLKENAQKAEEKYEQAKKIYQSREKKVLTKQDFERALYLIEEGRSKMIAIPNASLQEQAKFYNL